ncbi:glycosyltransferase [Streptomyces sp. NPDC005133]
MKVLFAATPGVGHVRPLLPVLDAFRAAGHEVSIAISDGIDVTGLDGAVTRYDKGPARFPRCPYGPGPERVAWWSRVNTQMAWASYLDSSEIIEDFRPDLLIRDSAERGAYLAAEVAGLEHATVFAGSETALAPYLLREARMSAPWRAALGLPEDPQGATQVPLLGIGLTHPDFYGPDAELVPRAAFYRSPEAGPYPGAEHRGPFILVSMGTTEQVPHLEFTRRILTGLNGSGVQVAATVPDDCQAVVAEEFGYADILGFSDLTSHLNRADVVVTHGGFGTVQAALRRGIPLHITPFHSDQFFNAERVSACGVGTWLPWDSCTPGRLARSVMHTVHDPSFKASAQRFAQRVRSLPGLEEGVRALEQGL